MKTKKKMHVNNENIEMCYLVLYFVNKRNENKKLREKRNKMWKRRFFYHLDIFGYLAIKKSSIHLANPHYVDTKAIIITVFQ